MADEQIPAPPKGTNQHTGKRAQRIERMRDTLWAGIQRKDGKLDRDMLIAMKMLMELDGIHGEKVPAVGGKQRGRKPKALRSVIKVPALLESA